MNKYIVPAKINLALEVVAKRSDGYHELNTIFHKINEPHDILTVTRSDAFRLTSTDPSLQSSTNLVTHAMQAVANALGEQMPGLAIHLEKGIPTGAGLGGGSSDAATALRIANTYYRDRLTNEQLHRLAARLGADVPFFLSSARTAIGTGIGDKLQPITIELPYPTLIVKPKEGSISTKDAYNEVRVNNTRTDFSHLMGRLDLSAFNQFRNDFEPALFSKYEWLKDCFERIQALGADYIRMTGSGSAFYALFTNTDLMHHVAELLQKEGHFVAINPASD